MGLVVKVAWAGRSGGSVLRYLYPMLRAHGCVRESAAVARDAMDGSDAKVTWTRLIQGYWLIITNLRSLHIRYESI